MSTARGWAGPGGAGRAPARAWGRAAALAAACGAFAACGGPPRPPAPVPVRTIAMNSQVTGVITKADPRLRDSSSYQLWRFAGTAGQMVQVDLISDEFDAFLYLRDSAGGELAHDDDGGGGTNARILYTLPYSGAYQIVANSYRAGQGGHYTLGLKTLAAAGGVLPGTVGKVARGQTVTGRLRADSPRLNDGSVYEAWTFMGTAGDTIEVDLDSNDFDAYAILQNGNGERLAEDDDSGGGTNARIVYTLPYTGPYRILANTYKKGSFGAYTLSVK